ncbi:nucleoporin Nup43 [Erpetoichthys calabaricus]|uniref:Nucleoporin 43 n=1 Tax=Erpetoichthys calabaricus TaxID=27687 RepID=A0A8C4RF38_ERPCA|nr:nucleoporin Nup43 [Erpetoichthys calabaricus]
MELFNAKFVSHKISRTRWSPVSSTSLQSPEIFATGSWDNEHNKISIWSIKTNVGDDHFEGDPQLLCEYKHDGDVMDLQFLDQEKFAVASSTGSLTIYRFQPSSQKITVVHQWDRTHYYSYGNAPCTSVACRSPEIVTVGEDGRINLFRMDHKGIEHTIDNADSSTIHAVTFLRTDEVLTVNSIGQLKMWDIRQGNKPSQILSISGDRVPLHCVDRHPNQQHIVATGGQEGMLCIWDVRQGTVPCSLLEAHSAEMWEVHFHPSNPDHLFTCSEDGSLWHWDNSGSDNLSLLQSGRNASFMSRNMSASSSINQPHISSWLNTHSAKGRLETTNLLSGQNMSVNSLDVLGKCLVCGTDGEAIYVTRHLGL